jgi:hypothetical protein
VDCDPVTFSGPDQPPDAAQEVALVADQDNVALLPLAMVLGLAAIVTVGAGEVTDTVADWTAVPPEPLQVSVYVALAVNAPVVCTPLVPLLPDQAPEPTQEVALVADQLSVEVPLLDIVLGLAVKLTVGTGCATDTVTDCAALAPLPVQVSV